MAHAHTRLTKHWTGNEPKGARYVALDTVLWGRTGEIHAGEEIPPYPLPAGQWYLDDEGVLWRQTEFIGPPERHPGKFPDREDLVERGLAERLDRKGRRAAA